MAKFRLGIDLRLYGAEHSGLGRYSAEILDALLRYGHDLDIVGFVDSYSANKEKLAALGVAIIDAPYRPYSWQEQILLPSVIAKAKVDLVHFPHFNVPLTYGGPYVVTIHDLIMHHFPWRTTSQRVAPVFFMKHLAYRATVRRAINRARAVIAVSRYTAEDILTYYPQVAGRLKIILEPAPILGSQSDMKLGVSRDLKRSVPEVVSGECRDDKDILLKYNIGRPYILIVGNLYPHKNTRTVKRVWQRLNPLAKRQLVIVGRLEALAMGTLVLSSPNGPLPEIYQNGATYIPVDNEEVMYRALYKIFNRQVNTTRPEFKESYNLKDVATSLENCYYEVLRSKE